MKEQSLVTLLMTRKEAEKCVRDIRCASSTIRELLIDLHDREGWRALGYESFSGCAQQEFGSSTAYIYRQLAVGSLEQRLEIGDVGDNKESHLRPLLTILKEDSMREEAWHLAHAMSPAPTAKIFEGAAYSVLVSSAETEMPILVSRMRAGEISPQTAYSILRTVGGRAIPDELKHVCSFISDPALTPMLRRVYYDDSDTWNEIVATGCIPSAMGEQVPVELANVQTLRAYLYVDANEHRAVMVERSREYWDTVNDAVAIIIAEARKARACSDTLSAAIDGYDAIVGKEVGTVD